MKKFFISKEIKNIFIGKIEIIVKIYFGLKKSILKRALYMK